MAVFAVTLALFVTWDRIVAMGISRAPVRRGLLLDHERRIGMVGRNIMKQRIHSTREWVRRREVAHKEYTADDLWAYIKKSWPTMTSEEWEELFQSAYVHKKGHNG